MVDKLLSLAADPIRRRVLFALLSADSVQLPDDIHRGEMSRHELEVQLNHIHLPKLADADLITWDRDRGVVSRGAAYESARELFEFLQMWSQEGEVKYRGQSTSKSPFSS